MKETPGQWIKKPVDLDTYRGLTTDSPTG